MMAARFSYSAGLLAAVTLARPHLKLKGPI